MTIFELILAGLQQKFAEVDTATFTRIATKKAENVTDETQVTSIVEGIIKSWRDNWERLTEYFQYTPMIRKLIYFYCPPKKTPESVSRYNKFPFYGLWQTELHIRHEHFFCLEVWLNK